MKSMTTIVAVALAASLPAVALAGTRDLGVNHRQATQQARIFQGVSAGELTRGEVRMLEAQRREIRREERAYKSDGRLTVDERTDLQRDLNAARRSIYGEKHDAERRF
jgi:hypothetical protein